jgi:3'(2'), 5'-bisphosphate nucleotidase
MSGQTSVIDDLENRLDDVKRLLRGAGDAIMEVYANEFDVIIKTDKSPVTIADTRSNDIITEGLNNLFPDVPVLSEENQAVDYNVRRHWEYYWLVDPLDGTREFIKRNNEFCINLALMHRDKPVAGFIHQPVGGSTYYAISGGVVYRTEASNDTFALTTKAFEKKDALTIVASRSHSHPSERKTIDALRDAGYDVRFVSMGSAIKFCLMAEGSVHMYLRYGPTSEWDTAAGHALLQAIGGTVVNTNSRSPLVYNKKQLLNPSFAALGPSVQQLTDYLF